MLWYGNVGLLWRTSGLPAWGPVQGSKHTRLGKMVPYQDRMKSFQVEEASRTEEEVGFQSLFWEKRGLSQVG